MKKENVPDHFVIDDRLWENLKNSDTEIICRNCEIFFDSKDQFYTIPVLNEKYTVFPWKERILKLPDLFEVTKAEIELSLFLLHYLLGTKNIPLNGKMVSEKDLKGGEMFFRGPHSLPIGKIIKRFGKDPNGLIQAGTLLGGNRIDLGDASIELRAAPKIPITYVLWAEDDEFPASVTMLFDPTIQEFLPLDIIFGISIFVYKSLTK